MHRQRGGHPTTGASRPRGGSLINCDFTLRFLLPFHTDAGDMLVELLRHTTSHHSCTLSSGHHRATLRFRCSEFVGESTLADAIRDVRRCIPTAQFVEAGPDWVTLTGIARAACISRQAMRKLMLTHSHSFPPPVHEGDPSIWHLAEVLDWLDIHAYGVDSCLAQVAQVAQAAMDLNLRRYA